MRCGSTCGRAGQCPVPAEAQQALQAVHRAAPPQTPCITAAVTANSQHTHRSHGTPHLTATGAEQGGGGSSSLHPSCTPRTSVPWVHLGARGAPRCREDPGVDEARAGRTLAAGTFKHQRPGEEVRGLARVQPRASVLSCTDPTSNTYSCQPKTNKRQASHQAFNCPFSDPSLPPRVLARPQGGQTESTRCRCQRRLVSHR